MVILAATPAIALTAYTAPSAAQAPSAAFKWPDGVRAAVSLSFDDARESQLKTGVPLFERYNTAVTFYLTAQDIGSNGPAWRKAAALGHEMGNHTMIHPCSGNFPWAREKALEDYTIDRMRTELLESNKAIEAATGVRPVTFAYTCGHSFVGRGRATVSTVPLVSELFLAGRGWLAESSNDPAFVDLAQLLGYPMDDVEFAALKPVVDEAIANGRWLVLAGHDIGEEPGPQVTRVSMLRDLLAYLGAPERKVWVDTVARVAEHVAKR
jgi:peptidoglycan/xylan/chitin deacetylase (PgdA/CDA1 family)